MTKFSGLATEYAEADLDSVKDYLFITRKDTANVSALSPLDEFRNWITANATKLSVASGTLTASTPISITQTWNSGATTFTAAKVNVTDTASASGSLLQDWQVGGASKASIDKNGSILVSDGTASLPTVAFSSSRGTGLRYQNSGVVITASGADIAHITIPAISMRNNGRFAFSQSSSPYDATDVALYRDAAAQLALRNSTNPQSLAVYSTYTSASDYNRFRIASTTSVVSLVAEVAGTSVSANVDIALTPANSGRVKFGTHSAIGAETVTGYITIKDSSGTDRKIAVVS